MTILHNLLPSDRGGPSQAQQITWAMVDRSKPSITTRHPPPSRFPIFVKGDMVRMGCWAEGETAKVLRQDVSGHVILEGRKGPHNAFQLRKVE
jgi:ribosomal protein L19